MALPNCKRPGPRHPAWLAARRMPGNRLSPVAIADDRTGPTGEPLFFHSKDSLPVPGPIPLLELGNDASRPGAPRYRLHGREGPGMPISPWPRRVMLTWALQAGRLLARLPPDARVDWELAPVDRLSRLAPFVSGGNRLRVSSTESCLAGGRLSRDGEAFRSRPGRVARPQDRITAGRLRRDSRGGWWNDLNLSETRRRSARRGMGCGF